MRPFSRACFVVACLAALTGPLQAAQIVALGASNTIGRGRGSTPDGVRLVLSLPPGPAGSGPLTLDWVRPTLSGAPS